MAVQIGSAAGARRAVADGADVLIAQGVEAGGHVQSTTRSMTSSARCSTLRGTTPVIATGGLALPGEVARVRELGAAAAMLGTRFVATAESAAHAGVQSCAGGGRCASHRTHSLLLRALAVTRPTACCATARSSAGRRRVVPLLVAVPARTHHRRVRAGTAIPRYGDAPPLAGDTGAVGEMCLYAGAGCTAIDDVPTAAELIDRLRGR